MKNHTKQALEEAKEIIDDEGVFTPDQISLLNAMIEKIAEAFNEESVSINYPRM